MTAERDDHEDERGWTPAMARRRHLAEGSETPQARFAWVPPLNWRAVLLLLAPAVVILGWWMMRANAVEPQTVPAKTLISSSSTRAAVASSPTSGPTATPTAIYVHVVGAVTKPGLVQVSAGSRVAEAIEKAGGVSGQADLARVNLARPLSDGEQIVVPRPGESPITASGGSASGPVSGGPSIGGGAAVDLNSATVADLDALPGIGPVLAQRIIDFRGSNGGFHSVDELSDVPGIGDKVMTNLRPLVRV